MLKPIIPLLAVAAALLTGCGSTYEKLPRLEAVPDLYSLAESSRNLPDLRGVTRVTSGEQEIDLAWRETRSGKEGWLVVMLHGVLSNSRTWDFMAGRLGRDLDLLLIDLPGCGLSQKPDPDEIGTEHYSPSAMAGLVLQVIRERLAEREDAPRLAFVGHSLGGMVFFRMLGDQALRARFPDTIARLEKAILLAPVDFYLTKQPPELEAIAELSPFEVFFGDFLGILKERVSAAVFEGSGNPARMPRREVDRLVSILREGDTRRSAQAMLREAIPWNDDDTLDLVRVRQLVADYKNVDIPCLILWGKKDQIFPVTMGYKLRAQLPRAWLTVIEGIKHSLPTEAPQACARHVLEFLSSREDPQWTGVRFIPLDRPSSLIANVPPAPAAAANAAIIPVVTTAR